MKAKLIICFLALMILLIPIQGNTEVIPSISGMSKIDSSSYLIVHDFKFPKDKKERFAILSVLKMDNSNKDKSVLNYESLNIDNWPKNEVQPSDLESLCKVPDSKNLFIAAESGYYNKKFGRFFIIQVNKENNIWISKYIKTIRPLKHIPGYNNQSTTSPTDQIEAINCLKGNNNKQYLILVSRGGIIDNKQIHSNIIIGELNLKNNIAFKYLSKTRLTKTNGPLKDRESSDIIVLKENSNWKLISSATLDLSNYGPFRTIIYQPGTLSINKKNELIYNALQSNKILWSLDGIKVESLSESPDFITQSKICVGSDDEYYQAVWRPLFDHLN